MFAASDEDDDLPSGGVLPPEAKEVLMTRRAFERHKARMGVPPSMRPVIDDPRTFVNNAVFLLRDLVPTAATDLQMANQARANSVAASMVMRDAALRKTSVDTFSLSMPAFLPRTFNRWCQMSQRSLPRSRICMGPHTPEEILASTVDWDRAAVVAGNPRIIVHPAVINIASQRKGVFTMNEAAAERGTADTYVRLKARFPAHVGKFPWTHNSSVVYPSRNIITTGPEQLPGIQRVMDTTQDRFEPYLSGVNPRLYAFEASQARRTVVVAVGKCREPAPPTPAFGVRPVVPISEPLLPPRRITFMDTEVARLPGDTPTLDRCDLESVLYRGPIPTAAAPPPPVRPAPRPDKKRKPRGKQSRAKRVRKE